MDIFSNTRNPPLTHTPSPTTTWPTTLLYTLLALALLTLITHTLSSRPPITPLTLHNQPANPVPSIPYHLPLLGHLPQLLISPATFLRNLHAKHAEGIFALNLGGTRHHVVSSPSLTTALLNQRAEVMENDTVVMKMIVNIFGMPASERKVWEPALADLHACYKYLMTEPALGEFVETTVKRTRENVVNLVSFTGNLVDQTLWERVADVDVRTNLAGEEVAEASLLPLIRDFCAHTATPSIMGTNFLTKFPDFFADLWTFDKSFMLLAVGLPRGIPIPLLTRGHIVRRKLINQMSEFHEAMEKQSNGEDPGPDWQDLDDVSTLVKERVKLYRKHGLSIRARAVSEEILAWASTSNSTMLVFWMVHRIYADAELLARVREEIAPYVKAIQPKQEFPIPEPSRLESVDIDGLTTKCALLKSCYIESLRLDTASWSSKQMKQDVVLQSREKDAPGWLLRKGEYAHAAHSLHSTDPKFFDDPLVWKADRHIRMEKDAAVADLGSIRPYGGGTSRCKGSAFAMKEIMVFAAAIIALWDMEPAGGGDWKMPRHKYRGGVHTTGDVTRVWIKRRKLPVVQ